MNDIQLSPEDLMTLDFVGNVHPSILEIDIPTYIEIRRLEVLGYCAYGDSGYPVPGFRLTEAGLAALAKLLKAASASDPGSGWCGM